MNLYPNIQLFHKLLTYLLSSTIHQFLFWLFSKFISHFEFLLKLYWGKLYLKGYWSYTYTVNGEKRYGAWCIDQDVDRITVKGFGITANRVRRSDVQSLTSLIPRGNDYKIVNMRRDINADGTMSDVFYYSKTTLHLQQRTTFLNLFNYTLKLFMEDCPLSEAIRIIEQADGIPVLAHAFYSYHDYDIIENTMSNVSALIDTLCDMGIKGIEIFYPKFSEEHTKWLLNVCQHRNLMITAGSDFHGTPTRKNMMNYEIDPISKTVETLLKINKY